MTLTGSTRLAGVIGWPVAHSRSPRLHGFWLQTHGIDGAYVPLAVKPGAIEAALRGLAALGFAGANVTVPHKETVASCLDTLSDSARRIGAVNMVTVTADGRLLGDNSDAFGFLENLKAGAPGWPADRPAVILGAGGAARAVCVGLIDAGVPVLRVANRTRARAESLAADFGSRVEVHQWERRHDILAEAGLVVNTTSLGMTGKAPLEIDLDRLPDDGVVTDIVYAPLMTPLLRAAQARGNRVVDGLGMLLHQARPGFAAWFGTEPEVTPALRDFVAADLTS